MQIKSNSAFYPSVQAQTHIDKSSDEYEPSEGEIREELRSKQDELRNLDANEHREIVELQAIDSEVRSHEAAHQAAGGALAGAASFTYQKGPDGQMYAVAGEVPISASSGATPQESIAIAQQVRTAALAPANPSPQDLKVAASAFIMEMKAAQELLRDQQDKSNGLKIYQDAADEDKSQEVV